MAATEVLFEFVQVGPQMRVAAVDAESGVEVVVICPVSASKPQMQQLALAKLHKKLGAAQPGATQRLF
ncbi:MAG TPA: serine hydroxymethyltransferase [Devosia sp.]